MAAGASVSNAQANALNLANPTASTSPTGPTLQDVIPGLSGGVNTAMSNIQNLLSGLPSPSLARTTNAYWGVGAGQPAGGAGNTGDINSFIGQRGTDLYGQQAQANQQTGIQDLLSLIGGTSGTIAATPGQNLQNQQFNQSQGQQNQQFNQSQGQQNQQFYATLGQQGSQFDQSEALAQFNAMINALSLGQSVTGQTTQLPNITT